VRHDHRRHQPANPMMNATPANREKVVERRDLILVHSKSRTRAWVTFLRDEAGGRVGGRGAHRPTPAVWLALAPWGLVVAPWYSTSSLVRS
jgi:hypothetical protein